jgi:hypothetical protein
MTALWRKDDSGWHLLAPAGFPKEAELHDLIEEAPQLLPLSGSPQLVVVGREVQLGAGYVDLLAFEPSGRPVLLEIKLARNAEARRAVVAQILAYAGFLRGLDPELLDALLDRHLRRIGHASLRDAVAASDQEGSFDAAGFDEGLANALRSGAFRLVIVVDEAPPELARLVGYLESVAKKLVIDLITVAAYDVGTSRILVPQRVEPEREAAERAVPRPSGGELVLGAEDFAAAIDKSPEPHRPALRKLCDWAISLEREGLVKLATFHGTSGRLTLLPRLHGDEVGLVTIWNDNGAYLSFWRTVFERRAPRSIERVERLIAPLQIGTGNTVRAFDDELLAALTDAYREATLSVAGASASKTSA